MEYIRKEVNQSWIPEDYIYMSASAGISEPANKTQNNNPWRDYCPVTHEQYYASGDGIVAAKINFQNVGENPNMKKSVVVEYLFKRKCTNRMHQSISQTYK